MIDIVVIVVVYVVIVVVVVVVTSSPAHRFHIMFLTEQLMVSNPELFSLLEHM